MAPIRVVIADDHQVVQVGVRTALDRLSPQISIVGTAGSGKDLLALLAGRPCDVAVVDYAMPVADNEDYDGLRLLQVLRKRFPDLHLVMFSMIENPLVLHAAMEAGVRGLVSKASPMDELGAAVLAVAGHRSYVCRALRKKLFAEAGTLSMEVLSPCEAEVVRLFAQGLSVGEIAAHLNRSVKTVSHQKAEAMRKLGVSNPTQLYAYALEHGLKT